jgi:hypothetical protein
MRASNSADFFSQNLRANMLSAVAILKNRLRQKQQDFLSSHSNRYNGDMLLYFSVCLYHKFFQCCNTFSVVVALLCIR